jgi:hypothetical protein
MDYNKYLKEITTLYANISLYEVRIAMLEHINQLNLELEPGIAPIESPNQTPDIIRLPKQKPRFDFAGKIEIRYQKIDEYIKKCEREKLKLYQIYDKLLRDKKITPAQLDKLLQISSKKVVSDMKVKITPNAKEIMKIEKQPLVKPTKKAAPPVNKTRKAVVAPEIVPLIKLERRLGEPVDNPFFQRNEGLSCGRNALNNMFGKEIFMRGYTEDPTKISLKQIWMDVFNTSRNGVRYDNEYYSADILSAAMNQYGYDIDLNHNGLISKSTGLSNKQMFDQLSNYFVNGGIDVKLLINKNGNHWVSALINAENYNITYYDSLSFGPIKFNSMNDFLEYLKILIMGNSIHEINIFVRVAAPGAVKRQIAAAAIRRSKSPSPGALDAIRQVAQMRKSKSLSPDALQAIRDVARFENKPRSKTLSPGALDAIRQVERYNR